MRLTSYVTTTVTLTNPTETGLAKEATLARRYSPSSARSTAAALFSAAGDSAVVIPPSGKAVRLYWIALSTSQTNPGENLVTVKFGASGTPLYQWYMGNPGAFSHYEIVQGAVDQSLYVNLANGTNPVLVNVTWEFV